MINKKEKRQLTSLVLDSKTNEESDVNVSSDFPYRGNICDLAAYPNRTYPWHWHNEVEFFFMEEGELDYHLPGKIVHFKKDDAGFINANVIHKTVGGKKGECIQQEHIFLPAFLGSGMKLNSAIDEKYIIPLLKAKNFTFAHFKNGSEKAESLKKLMKESLDLFSKKSFGFEAEIRSLMTKAWILILEECLKSQTYDNKEKPSLKRLKKMLTFIEENFENHITLEQIAQSANIGQRECTRCFTRELSCSPVDYLIEVRINKAQAYLKTSDMKIETIAALCGFSNSNYFCRIFKQRTGKTPGQWR